MAEPQLLKAIGLMSGTSLDGVDAVFMLTDGHHHIEVQEFISIPYPSYIKDQLRACLGKRTRDAMIDKAERHMTEFHIDAVQELARKARTRADIIGFHGQTITHDPHNKFTWQLGDAKRMALETKTDVVFDLRQADIQAGGQGAPLLPVYHQALALNLPKPCAILNIGGVSNVTWLGDKVSDILAFDTGPGNALMDDCIMERLGQPCDHNGALARAGQVHQDIVYDWLSQSYFQNPPPKSLDRNAWNMSAVERLSTEDALATLNAFTVQSVVESIHHMPTPPHSWYVCGGGRKNVHLMQELHKAMDGPVWPVEALGWNGDSLEAEGFAYLAVRSLLGLPLTMPSTTGVSSAISGGVHIKAA